MGSLWFLKFLLERRGSTQEEPVPDVGDGQLDLNMGHQGKTDKATESLAEMKKKYGLIKMAPKLITEYNLWVLQAILISTKVPWAEYAKNKRIP